MRILSLGEVGVISFVQSIIMFVSFSQIGLLNGGYRLVSKSDSHIRRINDFIFSYNFYLLCGAITLVLPIYFIFNFSFDLYILIYSIVAGFISIVSNWVSNLLIANQKINLLNKVNLVSLALSFLCLLLINISSVWSGILFVTSQLFLIILLSLYFGEYKFTLKLLDKRTFKYILMAGFTPFLINILGSLFLLSERWVISLSLGIESLGRYYLVGVYTVFFQLVPGALNNLEFPAAMRTFKKKTNPIEIIMGMKIYFVKLLIYSILVGFLTYFLAEPVINIFLPQYLGSVHLLKVVFWGLALTTLAQPIILVFQVKLEYKLIIFIYLFATCFVMIAYFLFSFRSDTDLDLYALLNLIYNLIVALLFLVIFYYKIKSSKLQH